MPRLSCAMIVRDAESTLQRALESVRAHVDELVIVDTGSVDGTCAIAAEYADALLSFDWCDDFSAARQFAMDSCTGEWIMWLDADDEFICAGGLHQLLEACPADKGGLLLRYVTDRAPDGTPTMEFWRERIVRRGAMEWHGRIHEVMEPIIDCRLQRIDGPYVLHHGHAAGTTGMQRNIRLLRLELEDHPTNTRAMFYLGRDLIQMRQLGEGQAVLERYVDRATWPDEQFMAQALIAFCHRAAGRFDLALRADLLLLEIHPTWPQAYFALAEDAYYLKRWADSVLFCNLGRQMPPPVTNLFVNRRGLEFDWMIFQCVSLWMVGLRREALSLTRKALKIDPTDTMHQANRAYFLDQLKAAAAAGAA